MTEPMSDKIEARVKQQVEESLDVYPGDADALLREIDRLRAELKEARECRCTDPLLQGQLCDACRRLHARRPTIAEAIMPQSPKGWKHNKR